MKEPKTGVQLYTLRDYIQTAPDFDRTLSRLRQMGVSDIQISGIGGDIPTDEIARIVTAKLGDDFIDVPLPKNFDEKFAESLLVPIEINEDDTPEKAELKRQVKEARKILVEAVKRGESPRQILTEEAKTLRRLMQTRDNYQRILNEQIENGASDQEINDTVNAANKMLEREGSDAKVMLPWKTRLRIKQGKADGTILD